MKMNINKRIFAILGILAVLLIPGMGIAAQDAVNITAECVADYDAAAGVDYFPEKAEIDFATGFTVEYFDNYKVVTVPDVAQYVLVQCGTSAPEGYDDALVVEVPVDTVVALSTTYLPHLNELGLLDALVGLDTFTYTTTEAVIEKIEAGDVVEVGGGASGSDLNIEIALDLAPDLLLTDTFGAPADTDGTLADAGIVPALAPDFLEATPLGRAEWLKFTALFFNAEGAAETLFDEKVEAYQGLVDLAADIPDEDRVTVLTGTLFGDTWYMPSAQSFAGQLVTDAGGLVAMANDPALAESPSAAPFSFEAVYEGALDADVWLANVFNANTLDELAAQDARYADFAAFQNGMVYNNSKRSNANGGSDYYEFGVTNPHLVLADLIAIFYPELTPDHESYYFVRWE